MRAEHRVGAIYSEVFRIGRQQARSREGLESIRRNSATALTERYKIGGRLSLHQREPHPKLFSGNLWNFLWARLGSFPQF